MHDRQREFLECHLVFSQRPPRANGVLLSENRIASTTRYAQSKTLTALHIFSPVLTPERDPACCSRPLPCGTNPPGSAHLHCCAQVQTLPSMATCKLSLSSRPVRVHVFPLAVNGSARKPLPAIRHFRAASPMCGNALLAAIALKLVWCLFTLVQAVSLWMADSLMLVQRAGAC